MLDLSNGANWTQIYNQRHYAQTMSNYSNKHLPILPITIPAVIDRHVIAVLSSPVNPKPTWDLGARIHPIINVSGIGRMWSSKSYFVGINEPTMIQMVNLGSSYQVGIDVPDWFTEVLYQVWVFQGEVVKTIEETLKDLQNQLLRIEYKVDSIQAWGQP